MRERAQIIPLYVAAPALCISLTVTGCSDAIQLVQETPSGGVVTYPFKADRGGPVMSPFRKEANALMMKKCAQGYRIVREGESRGYSSVSGVREGTEDEGIGRRWGIQFECRETP